MRCPNHPDARINEGGGFSTLMSHQPYWEDGVRHSHDPNALSMAYLCAEGCVLKGVKYGACPAPECEYGREPMEITVVSTK